jgi:hypothetical protein
MNFKISTKKETKKTLWRNLKKQKQKTAVNIRLKAMANSTYTTYNILSLLIKTQQINIRKNVISNIILEESGVSLLLCFWLKTYTLKIY